MTANLKLLLECVEVNGSVEPLRRLGLEYVQIAELLGEALSGRFLALEGQSVVVTDVGREFLGSSSRSRSGNASGSWIDPMVSAKIPKLSVEDIFLPDSRTAKRLKSKG